ncbi:hypothetical protein RN001_005267 [Aquatica leii]|uniref:Uncharacterized protein n=1 Tax=Aquatica leii TaxID=1421715 RepID=A0AAN7PCI8_9COLE|nr:hypothetical protein RN001_005267 [Aquatica leii]
MEVFTANYEFEGIIYSVEKNMEFHEKLQSDHNYASEYFKENAAATEILGLAEEGSGWREAAVENRLNILENRVALLEKRSLENVNVLIERVRKDAEEQFHKRVLRQASAVAATSSVFLGTHKRTTRDVPECICPAVATKEENLPIDSTFNVDNENKQNNKSEQINLSLIEDEDTNAKIDFNNPKCEDVDPISLIENAEMVILDNNNQINVQFCDNSGVNLVDNMEIESEECNVDDPGYCRSD